jgi:hypothetical protein
VEPAGEAAAAAGRDGGRHEAGGSRVPKRARRQPGARRQRCEANAAARIRRRRSTISVVGKEKVTSFRLILGERTAGRYGPLRDGGEPRSLSGTFETIPEGS